MQIYTKLIKTFPLYILFILIPLFMLNGSAVNSNTAMLKNSSIIRNGGGDNNNLSISLETISKGIGTVAADPDNPLLLKVRVKDAYGRSLPNVTINFSISSTLSELIETQNDTFDLALNHDISYQKRDIGTIQYQSGLTGPGGIILNAYTPPALNHGTEEIIITASIDGSEKNSTLMVRIIPVPVVLVHGYQATQEILSGMYEYLSSQGFKTMRINYDSEAGVAAAASELSDYLDRKKAELASDGIQTSRFDLIAHSMGGLVARYYTSNDDYGQRGDIRKLIFISVPQQGSHFASLGQKYFADNSIRDMSEGSRLFTDVFPMMKNGGLNLSIQTAALLGQYDEVVSAESASLTPWGLKTEMFDVGDNNLTVEKLLSGEILNASNHKHILYNGVVFKRIKDMLEQQLPYPSVK